MVAWHGGLLLGGGFHGGSQGLGGRCGWGKGRVGLANGCSDDCILHTQGVPGISKGKCEGEVGMAFLEYYEDPYTVREEHPDLHVSWT